MEQNIINIKPWEYGNENEDDGSNSSVQNEGDVSSESSEGTHCHEDLHTTASASDKKSTACPLCHKVFIAHRYLQIHIKVNHPNLRRHKISDDLIGIKTVHESVETISMEKIQCPVCAKQYDNMTDYTHHLTVHLQTHDKPEVLKVKCSVCQKLFFDRILLEKHIQTHVGKHPSLSLSQAVDGLSENAPPQDYNIISLIKIESQCPQDDKQISNNRAKIILAQNSFQKCVMCRNVFHPTQIEKHLWECKAKLPCLNKIVEIKSELKEVSQEFDDFCHTRDPCHIRHDHTYTVYPGEVPKEPMKYRKADMKKVWMIPVKIDGRALGYSPNC